MGLFRYLFGAEGYRHYVHQEMEALRGTPAERKSYVAWLDTAIRRVDGRYE